MISKKVEYMKIAAALCDFHIGEKELDLSVFYAAYNELRK